MRKKNTKNRGFTLIELLIAMTIFVMFVGVLMGSYISVIKGQKEANDYRILYSESRRIFEMITDEVKNGMVYYPKNEGGNTVLDYQSPLEYLVVVNKNIDGLKVFKKDGDDVRYCDNPVQKGLDYTYSAAFGDSYLLNEGVKIKDFSVRIYPAADPYRDVNAEYDSLQFQPLVHVSAVFEKEISGGKKFEISISTSVSSRYYSESIPISGAEICGSGIIYPVTLNNQNE